MYLQGILQEYERCNSLYVNKFLQYRTWKPLYVFYTIADKG